MELVSKTDEEFTIKFAKRELANLMAIVHSASVLYGSLTADIHNLSKQQIEKLEDDLYDLN